MGVDEVSNIWKLEESKYLFEKKRGIQLEDGEKFRWHINGICLVSTFSVSGITWLFSIVKYRLKAFLASSPAG